MLDRPIGKVQEFAQKALTLPAYLEPPAAHLDAEALLELRVCDVAVQLGAVVVLRCVVKEGLDHDAALAADVCNARRQLCQACLILRTLQGQAGAIVEHAAHAQDWKRCLPL
jgi:hypothetical protein